MIGAMDGDGPAQLRRGGGDRPRHGRGSGRDRRRRTLSARPNNCVVLAAHGIQTGRGRNRENPLPPDRRCAPDGRSRPARDRRASRLSAPGSRKSPSQTSWRRARWAACGGNSRRLQLADPAGAGRCAVSARREAPTAVPCRPETRRARRRAPAATPAPAAADSARSILLTLPEAKRMPAPPSRQNQTVWAASHSRSRTNRCCDLADCRQSIARRVFVLDSGGIARSFRPCRRGGGHARPG